MDLKKRFSTGPVLRMPDASKPFQIECDASKYASGAVLTQEDENGLRHPVAYISKSFSPAERNYEIYDRELLAMIRALAEWRYLILGSEHPTTVLSDHKNLTYYRSAQNLNRRQARWALKLQEYDIVLVHTPGSKMIQSDVLSRRPDLCPEEDHDNEDVTMLPNTLFVNFIDAELQNLIAKETDYDHDVLEALRTLQGGSIAELGKDLEDWEVEQIDGKPLIFYKGKNYIPRSVELRRRIVKSFHDDLTAGHPGELETYNSVREHYWWPGMRVFVKNYVKGCATCQQFKINRSPTKPSLYPIIGPTSTRPFLQISMDLITDLPPASGFDAILVVVDHGLTKGAILTECTKTITGLEAAKILLVKIYCRFGLPDKIISDRGPQFASMAFRELLKLLEIKSSLSTAYHPQSDGTTERYNQEIEAYLAIYCYQNQDDWPEALPTLEFTHNNRRHSDRMHTPFELLYGVNPKAIPTTFDSTKFETIEKRLEHVERIRKEALAAHELARHRMAQRIDSTYTPFKKGDKVWLEAKNLKARHHKKMGPKRHGPFKIKEVMGPVNYRLSLPKTWKIHDVFHATLLSPYRETEVHGKNLTRPPPEIINEEEEYEIDFILRHKFMRKRGDEHFEYEVKWKGYKVDEATWQREESFEHGKDILRTYQTQNKIPLTTWGEDSTPTSRDSSRTQPHLSFASLAPTARGSRRPTCSAENAEQGSLLGSN